MMKAQLRTLLGSATIIAAALIALLLFGGCEDPGSYGDVEPVAFGRVVAYNSATEPPMQNLLNDIWDEALTGGIVVSDSSFAAEEDGIDSMTVLVEAIKTSEYIYLRARWADFRKDSLRTYSVWQNPAVHLLTIVDSIDTLVNPPDTIIDTTLDTWNRRPYKVIGADTTWLVQDRFAIMWDAGFNGDEKADCRTMCHAPGDLSIRGHRMFTTGGGHVDVWHWQAATTDPVLLAQDEYWGAEGRDVDAFTQEIFSNNYETINFQPIYMHQDPALRLDPFLHVGDAVAFDDTLVWLDGNTLPAHILHDNAAGSIADVDCFSTFSRKTGWWTVMMRRALATGNGDDVDLSGIVSGDSIQVTIAFMNHNDSLHHGSRPFYIIFP